MKHGIEVGMNLDQLIVGNRLLKGIGREDQGEYDEIVEAGIGEGLIQASYAVHVTRLNI